MYISLLGPLTIQHGDQEKGISSKQARTLLAVLALSSGNVVSSQRLVSEFWEDEDVRNSRNALQAVVSRLRRVLRDLSSDSTTLETVGEGYRLNIKRFQVDAFEFAARMQRAQGVRQESPAESLELTEAALALWRGHALEGLGDLPCLRAEQARLTESRLAALELVAELRLETGDVRMALGDLRHLAEVHGNRERLCELLMLALYRDGRQMEALDVFRRTSSRLRSEIGVDPSRGLRRVHHLILTQDPALEAGPLVRV
ncbi:AfsR/SARP family transcriptional regulator [Luteipulveratus flavus]|uniref:AfsR/SARP family transcriptional regulator n=1 Tax=Luteipulveratus flavus TaxID=3031728 RepID=A0ABT6C8E0_9MICO|nr:AfsR/SARP family transcriptional regulator [Luteipulveratus sp. YIM 133296]MDF8264572.1 AfsR/SARP family transcriptional regulator [Luteipulveratus sp. YIM 133296]